MSAPGGPSYTGPWPSPVGPTGGNHWTYWQQPRDLSTQPQPPWMPPQAAPPVPGVPQPAPPPLTFPNPGNNPPGGGHQLGAAGALPQSGKPGVGGMTSVQKWTLAITTAVAATLGFVIFLAVALAPWSPDYSLDEQQFLAEVHHSNYTGWPSDKELVREGHQVCAILNSNGGNAQALYEERMWGYGPDPMPGFMQSYASEDQRYELVKDSTHHFCDQYTLYVGGVPIGP